MQEQQSQQLRGFTILIDVCLTIGSFLLAHHLRIALGDGGSEPDLLPHLTLLGVIVPIWVFLLSFFGAYRGPRMTSLVDYAWGVTRALGIGFGILLSLVFLLRLQYVSRSVMTLFVLLNLASLIGVRLTMLRQFRRSLRRAENFRKVLIIGSGNRARRLADALLRTAEQGIHIIGYLDPETTQVDQRLRGAPVIGTVDEIASVLKNYVIDEVIVATPRAMIGHVEKVARACEEEGIKVSLMADLFDMNVARMRLGHFGSIPLLTFEPVAQEEWKLLLKRMMDLTAALAVLPLVLPIMAVVAIAVRLESAGPVLFVQERVGFAKRRFRMLKFRTMVEGSELLQAQMEHLNEAQGPIFKIANDPRITRVGRFLRRTSLDELPQIFNVIKGEMSLVGPRPMSLRDVNLFDRGIQRKRFSIKPGLTCLWQVSGRSQLPFSKWLELDLAYIEQWSLGLDLKILLRTIPVVLRGTGAV